MENKTLKIINYIFDTFYLNMILSQMVDTVPYEIFLYHSLKYDYIYFLSWPEFMINLYHCVSEEYIIETSVFVPFNEKYYDERKTKLATNCETTTNLSPPKVYLIARLQHETLCY